MMKVTFIQHSSFLAELDHCCLLFDYYEGSVPKRLWKNRSTSLPVTATGITSPPLYSLWQSRAERFLSAFRRYSRTPCTGRAPGKHGFRCPPFHLHHRRFTSGHAGIHRLRRSILIECEGRLLYHAGDLNCWVWDGAPRYQNDMMEAQYKKELELLSGKRST